MLARLESWLERRPAALVVGLAGCFWPAWQWYYARLFDGSDEPWGIVALLTAVALTWPRGRGLKLDASDPMLKRAAGFACVYALVTPFAPPMIRALCAVAALTCCWSSVSGSRTALPVVATLAALSLPVIASLQFYLGYPLRVATAAGASELLGIGGFAVERMGTAMHWQDRVVVVDAPCSGVRMLWAGTFLACILMARGGVRWAGLFATLALVVAAVLVANIARAAVLFLLEIRPEPAPDLAHVLVGGATYVLLGLTIVAIREIDPSKWRRA